MNELQKIDSFRRELAITETIEGVKLHESAASAMAEFARANKISIDKQNELGRFRTDIEDKKGEVLEQMFPANGNENSASTTLGEADITFNESARAKKISFTSHEVKSKIMDEIEAKGEVITPNKVFKEIKKIEHKASVEKQKEEIISKPPELITDNFDVLVLDPPWNYGRKFDPNGSRVANPYPEMTQAELLKLDIPANDNAIMWLWTTQQFIWDAKELLNEWGFTYKAILVWDKEKIGMGYWLRMQAEFCLLAVKGKPIWDNTTFRDVIRESRREHSRKPEAFYEMVDAICYGSKIDYFSREQREGWTSFGNDVNKF